MKEDLADSLDINKRLMRMCQTVKELCQKVIDEHPKLNDELSTLIAGLYNGTQNVEMKLVDCFELLHERQAFMGDEGVDKQFKIKFGEEQIDEELPEPDYLDNQDDD